MRKTNFLIVSFILFIFSIQTLFSFELRTSAYKSTPKYISLEDNGVKKVGGLCVDIIRAIEKKDKDIKFIGDQKYLPFKRMELKMERGEIDVVCGLAKNENRIKKFLFLNPPLYSVSHNVAVKIDDNITINTFDDIRKLGENGRILTLDGTATYHYLINQGGLLVDKGAYTMENNLIKLLSNRGRFVYYHNLGLFDAIKRTNLSSKIKVLPVSFRTYHHFIVFSKKVSLEKIIRVQSVLEELSKSGELEIIFEKYIKFE